jgi:hypothetical protein
MSTPSIPSLTDSNLSSLSIPSQTISTSKPKKYIFIGGVMKLNPEYDNYVSNTSNTSSQGISSSSSHSTPMNHTVTPPVAPLAIISSFADIEVANDVCGGNGNDIQLSNTTSNAIQVMMDETYLSNYSSTIISEQSLFDGLCNYFVIYEVPIGLISKLMELRNYRLNFMIDDSGSMGSQTDV